MGTDDKTQNGLSNGANGDANGAPPPMPPPEEPPKLEEIVTPEVLEAIVKGYKPGLKVMSFHAEAGSQVGDNYMSIMYALEIELKDEKSGDLETLHCMLKTIPRTAFRADMINEMSAFKKESAIYQQILPVFVETQKEHDIPAKHLYTAWPICFAAHLDGSTDYLAMENLKVAGYKMGNRAVGLDYNHCALVLRNLARHHAISYVKYGGSRTKILETFPMLADNMFCDTSKTSQMQQQFMTSSFKSQAKGLRESGDELVASRLEKLATMNVIGVMGKMIDQKENPVAVVTHGDCWVNNMLFKYDDSDEKCKRPTGLKFLDFQLSQASSRLLDVYYFMMTSARLDVLNEREQDMLLTYYSEFTSFAQLLGVDTKAKGLTWDKFMEEAVNNKFYGVFMGILLAPMLGADAADIPDMDTMTEEDMNGSEEAMQNFFKDMAKGNSLKKVATICKDHLPQCPQGAEFL